MDIYPAIDLRGGKCVRLIQGDYARQVDYADDPAAVAVAFEQAGSRWLHMVDLDGARTGQPANLHVLAEVRRRTGLHIQFGGGMRDEGQIERAIEAGAGRVVIGTRAIQEWDWFAGLLRRPELAGRLALGLDARDGLVAVKGWVETSSLRAGDLAKRAEGLGVAAIIYTDISRDGMLTGPNFEATVRLAEETSIPVIASGGVGRMEDVTRFMGTAVAGVIVGRAIYEGRIDVAEAIRLTRSAPAT